VQAKERKRQASFVHPPFIFRWFTGIVVDGIGKNKYRQKRGAAGGRERIKDKKRGRKRETGNPKPEIQNPKSKIQNPKLETRNVKRETRNLKSSNLKSSNLKSSHLQNQTYRVFTVVYSKRK